MSTVRIDLLGIRVVLNLPEPLDRRFESLFPSAPADGVPPGRSLVEITARNYLDGISIAGGGPTIRVADEATALAHVLSRINLSVLAASPYFGIHAGVVAIDDRAVAFPAASGIGKSTLVAACLQAGMSYVSDEALCLDWTTGAIVGYPRPIGLSVASCRLLELSPDNPAETAWSASMLGAPTATAPLHLKHVILLDMSTADLAPTSRGAGAAELLTRSFNHWHRPERAFELTHEIVRPAQVWQMGRDDPATSAKRIIELARS